MLLGDFDYRLPVSQIAQRPLEGRSDSRLMVLGRASGAWDDRQVRELPSLLRGDELLVVNNARVIPARLFGRRLESEASRGEKPSEGPCRLSAQVEILLTRHISEGYWEALVRPGQKLKVGQQINLGEGELTAEIIAPGDYGERRVRFNSPRGSKM